MPRFMVSMALSSAVIELSRIHCLIFISSVYVLLGRKIQIFNLKTSSASSKDCVMLVIWKRQEDVVTTGNVGPVVKVLTIILMIIVDVPVSKHLKVVLINQAIIKVIKN